MEIFNSEWILPLLAAAAAWGGSRQALNGTRERVRSIDEKLDTHIQQVHTDIAQRLAVVEVKIDDHVIRPSHREGVE